MNTDCRKKARKREKNKKKRLQTEAANIYQRKRERLQEKWHEKLQASKEEKSKEAPTPKAPTSKKHIFIHPDRIEDLDETERKLEQNKKEAEPTGYHSICQIINKGEKRCMLLKSSFVRKKIKSGALFIFSVVNKSHEVMLQPVPIEFMNRTAINHVHQRSFSLWRRYGYVVPMDGTPEPAQVLHLLGLSPTLEKYTCRLEEYVVQDAAFGELMAYKIIPMHIG